MGSALDNQDSCSPLVNRAHDLHVRTVPYRRGWRSVRFPVARAFDLGQAPVWSTIYPLNGLDTMAIYG